MLIFCTCVTLMSIKVTFPKEKPAHNPVTGYLVKSLDR